MHYRYYTVSTAIVVAALATGGKTRAAPDITSDTEMQLLEGTWEQDPLKDGSVFYALHIKSGTMRRMNYFIEDGETVMGADFFEFSLDNSTKPKRITLTRGEGEDRHSMLGVYEVEGDTLTLAIGQDAAFPKTLEDKDARILIFKKAKPRD